MGRGDPATTSGRTSTTARTSWPTMPLLSDGLGHLGVHEDETVAVDSVDELSVRAVLRVPESVAVRVVDDIGRVGHGLPSDVVVRRHLRRQRRHSARRNEPHQCDGCHARKSEATVSLESHSADIAPGHELPEGTSSLTVARSAMAFASCVLTLAALEGIDGHAHHCVEVVLSEQSRCTASLDQQGANGHVGVPNVGCRRIATFEGLPDLFERCSSSPWPGPKHLPIMSAVVTGARAARNLVNRVKNAASSWMPVYISGCG